MGSPQIFNLWGERRHRSPQRRHGCRSMRLDCRTRLTPLGASCNPCLYTLHSTPEETSPCSSLLFPASLPHRLKRLSSRSHFHTFTHLCVLICFFVCPLPRISFEYLPAFKLYTPRHLSTSGGRLFSPLSQDSPSPPAIISATMFIATNR